MCIIIIIRNNSTGGGGVYVDFFLRKKRGGELFLTYVTLFFLKMYYKNLRLATKNI